MLTELGLDPVCYNVLINMGGSLIWVIYDLENAGKPSPINKD
jgi:hypothetical protein